MIKNLSEFDACPEVTTEHAIAFDFEHAGGPVQRRFVGPEMASFAEHAACATRAGHESVPDPKAVGLASCDVRRPLARDLGRIWRVENHYSVSVARVRGQELERREGLGMAVRVFISSRIDGMKRQRQAARLAIESLDQKAVMAEDFAASAATPRGACLQGVRDADVVVLLLGKSYGQTHESDISATEEEIDETRRLGKPVLAFLTSDERDGKQEEFLQRISGWSTGALHKAPGSLAELQKEIVRALRQATAAPPRADQNALVQQNLDLVTPRVQQGVFQDIGPWIAVSSAPSTDLALDEDQFFAEAAGKICDLCVTGTARLLEQRPRAKAESARLVFLHRQTSGHGPALLARVGLAGDMAVGTSFRNGNRTGAAGFLIASPTDAQKKFAHILSFMGRALDVLDPDKRAQTGLMQASLSNLGMAAFMEPSEDRGMGIPLNVRGREFLSLAPERPEPVSRTELRADGALPHRYIQRFLREARDSRHTGM